MRVYLQLFLLDITWRSYTDFKNEHYIEEAETSVIQYLLIFNLWHSLFVTLMNFFEPIPLIGPLVSLLVTLGAWTYTDVNS
jgi:hypothetical protein